MLAADGRVFGIPRNAEQVLIINPHGTFSAQIYTPSVSYIGNFIGTAKWSGGVRTHDGRIFCFPYMASSALIIDPRDDTLDNTTLIVPPGDYKWLGGVLGSNGIVWGAPFHFSSILRISPFNDTLRTIDLPSSWSTRTGWFGGACDELSMMIYFAPLSHSYILRVNPLTETLTLLSPLPTNGYAGGVSAFGLIFFIPHYSSSANRPVAILDPSLPYACP